MTSQAPVPSIPIWMNWRVHLGEAGEGRAAPARGRLVAERGLVQGLPAQRHRALHAERASALPVAESMKRPERRPAASAFSSGARVMRSFSTASASISTAPISATTRARLPKEEKAPAMPPGGGGMDY